MRVVADAGILGLEALDDVFDELILLPGRQIKRADLVGADALLVRSITKIDEALIADTGVRFVGTATSGRDHVDELALAKHGIAFADAKGANAGAVVDYVFACLAQFALAGGCDPRALRVGIVGLGCVGGLLDTRLRETGFTTLCCDPPLAMRAQDHSRFTTLDHVLACPIVCVHVPLTTTGENPTQNLIGDDQLRLLPRDGLLINPSRGGVVDEASLIRHARANPEFRYAADVWAGEPLVSANAIDSAWLATPHIAGYSVQAKRSATTMLLASLAEFDEMHAKTELAARLRAVLNRQQDVEVLPSDGRGGGWEAIASLFDVRSLDSQFRSALARGLSAEAFDALRQPLKARIEFGSAASTLLAPKPA